MNQIALFIGLFFFGLMFGLLFKKHLPIQIICGTAFLWGSLFWVISALVLLSSSIAYNLVSILICFSIALILIIYFHIRNHTWKLTIKEIIWVMGSLAGFSLMLIAVNNWNYSAGTMDSVNKIMTGKSYALDGLNEMNINALGAFGSFTMIIQSISVFINSDYIYLAQPAFAFSLFSLLVLLGKEILSPKIKHWLIFTLLVLGSFISIYFIRFQIFYIHDSLIAGTYLLIGLVSFWLSIKYNNSYWLIFGMLGFLGFCFARIETPLYAICFLAIIVSTQKISKKHQLITILPFLSIFILWYTRIFLILSVDGKLLKTSYVIVILAILLCFGLYVYLSSKLSKIEEKITPRIHQMMIIVLSLVLLVFTIQKPVNILTSIYNTGSNFLVNGLWGSASMLVIFYLFLLPVPKINHIEDRIFTTGFIAYLIMLMLIGGFRDPYRIGWSDSANRMLVQIIPSVFLYFIIKYRNFMEISQEQFEILIQQNKFQYLVVGMLILIPILVYIIGFNLLT